MTTTQLDLIPHYCQIDAYNKLVTGNRQIVYDCIKANQPIAAQQVAEILGWGINQVSGRITELWKPKGCILDTPLIRPCGYIINPKYGTKNTTWEVV